MKDFYIKKLYLKLYFFYYLVGNSSYKETLSLNIIDIYINYYRY